MTALRGRARIEIDEKRLTAKGLAATKPIDSNETAEGRANNRRVEFVKVWLSQETPEFDTLATYSLAPGTSGTRPG